MYDDKYVEWWLRRSSSPEYQEAYDRIASMVPVNPEHTFLDIACGNGEMIRRLYGKFRKLVGSDTTKEMLEIAAHTFYSMGVDVEVFDRTLTREEWDDEVKRDRIALSVDNITSTQLPKGYFDSVCFTFPNLERNKPTNKTIQRAHHLYDLYDLDIANNIALDLEAFNESLTMIKPGGILTFAVYAPTTIEYTGDRVAEIYVRELFDRTVHLLKHHSQHDVRIGRDTIHEEVNGYKIFVVRRFDA